MPDDAATLAAIDRVDRSVQSLRTDLTGRLDQMVTRKEHEAEVRRLDSEAQASRQALAEHERIAGKRLDEITEQHADLLQRLADADEKREAARRDAEKEREVERKNAAAQRKADRRWLITITITAVGVASGVSGVIFNAIGG